MKKLTFALIPALLFCGVIGVAFFGTATPLQAANDNDTAFTDIEGWYKPYIIDLASQGILQGRTESQFCPLDAVTRAEFVAILARLSGDNLTPYQRLTPSFPDISTTSWTLPYVEWGYLNKIVVGDNAGKFNPNAPVTRQDIAVMLCRYAPRVEGLAIKEALPAISFTDSSAIAPYAQEAVTTLTKGGIIEGYEDQSFGPQNSTLRGEIAKIISVYLQDKDTYQALGFNWRDLKYFMHAGGSINGRLYSNSLEALNNSLRHEQRFLEVDFVWTTDSQLVCLRHWDYINPLRGPMTLAKFKEDYGKSQMFQGLTPLALADLAQWLKDNPTAYIITDIKDDNLTALTIISRKYPELINRFLPQIYKYSEYEAVAALGYSNIILTTYTMRPAEVENVEALVTFAQSHKLLAITISQYYADRAGYVAKLNRSGVLTAAFTIDDPQEAANYQKNGVNVLYTDTLGLD